MAYQVVQKLPSVEDLHKKYPLTPELQSQVHSDIQDIKNILEGKDSRKILIVGPCSAWPSEAVVEYARQLLPLKEKYSDPLKFVMRVYIQKPRTTVGWVGPVNQPDPFDQPNLVHGFEYCRKMMLEVISMGYAIADEAVYTHKKGYFTDLYSWIAIGARSAEDQEHRLFASMLDVPVGMKNPTSGDVKVGVNSVIAAQYGHTFAIDGNQIRTDGNPHAHLILRGGGGKGNIDLESLQLAHNLLIEKGVKYPAILTDISHDNSIDPETGKKDPLLQPSILEHTVEVLSQNPDLAKSVKGFMVESFLEDGNQKASNPESIVFGKSITDGCVGMEKTKAMVEKLAEDLVNL